MIKENIIKRSTIFDNIRFYKDLTDKEKEDLKEYYQSRHEHWKRYDFDEIVTHFEENPFFYELKLVDRDLLHKEFFGDTEFYIDFKGEFIPRSRNMKYNKVKQTGE